MSMSKKIFFSFLIMALAAVGAFIGGWRSAAGLGHSLKEVNELFMPLRQRTLDVRYWFERIRIHERTLIASGLTLDERNTQVTRYAAANEQFSGLVGDIDGLFCDTRGKGFTAPETEDAWKNARAKLAEWENSTKELMCIFHEWDRTFILDPDRLLAELRGFRGDHYALVARLGAMLNAGEVSGDVVGASDTACAFGRWRACFDESMKVHRQTRDPNRPIILYAGTKDETPGAEYAKNEVFIREMEAIIPDHAAFHSAAHDMFKLIQTGDREAARKKYDEAYAAAGRVIARFDALANEAHNAGALMEKARNHAMHTTFDIQNVALDALADVVGANERESNVEIANAIRAGDSAILIAVLIAAIGIGTASILAYFIVSGIVRRLNSIIAGLGESSVQVAEAAGAISGSSSQLAEGATEQAASLEQTSSALEQMASMTRQNADNATRTQHTTGQTVTLIDKGAKAVNNMSGAMGEISDSAEKIGRIIKTIEEIAFQTNLLALNAAVEAARAGEAGKGFAVVADEVRNLAQRSAQAARDTAELIEGTVTRVKNGSEIATMLDSDFKEIESGAKDVGRLIAEITSATHEQAQGVDQVNTAVAQMDKVTQQNAANAEESASASEELSAQAEVLKGMVDDLTALVAGLRQQSYASAAVPSRPLKAPKPPFRRVTGGMPVSVGSRQLPPPVTPKVMRPNVVIPLDGDDFKDF